MTTNPESQEFLPAVDALHERFTKQELPVVSLQKNHWGTVSLQFADGSELLSMGLLRSKSEDYGITPKDPNLIVELIPELSPISALDDELVSHRIKGGFLFESKDKDADNLAVKDAYELVDFADNYEFIDAVQGLDTIIKDAVREKKDFRTRSLLEDLNRCLANIDYQDIWLKVHPHDQDGTTYAAQLVGFLLNEDSGRTAIEPIVQGINGTVGLLPPDVSIDPYVNVRVKD